ncbi:hypothetical protein LCGC14_1214780 [marine sediment metagenome]|uniref:Uncharacterized protein n=1 Tax=marine sediment metagenome TaxID=412755 RepID=A0A0F9LH77_9ZZZZ
MSTIDDWIYKKTNRYPDALPEHLKNWKGTGKVKLHNDWPPLLNKIPRSFNSFGPLAEGKPGFRSWPPKLVEGKGITRWENAGASSILYIPSLEDKTIDDSFYGTKIRAWETNPGHPNYREEIWILLDYEEGRLDPYMYSPSALQRWSPQGFLRMSPHYWSCWFVLKKNEIPFLPTTVTKENKVLFWRNGFRPDHLCRYYNVGPMLGLQMD